VVRVLLWTLHHLEDDDDDDDDGHHHNGNTTTLISKSITVFTQHYNALQNIKKHDPVGPKWYLGQFYNSVTTV
jgi:hypothetical protein